MRDRLIPELRNLTLLDRRVDQARDVLQRTHDGDPAFEKRVRNLVRLVDERERALLASSARPPVFRHTASR
jgi:hypothetical protein